MTASAALCDGPGSASRPKADRAVLVNFLARGKEIEMKFKRRLDELPLETPSPNMKTGCRDTSALLRADAAQQLPRFVALSDDERTIESCCDEVARMYGT